ncbi:MAG: MarR family transcriptional regulator [Epulopiscium sp.]|nr:MarR family transcriptional regulator [Candidatus Epulonipiscium sp.]
MKDQKEIGKMIYILSKQMKRQFDKSVSKNEITSIQARIMHYILEHSPERDIFQKDIEEEFNIRRSSATGILKLMEKNRMIKREIVSYDARLKKIILTEKALKMEEEIAYDIQRLEKKLIKDISEEEIEIFSKVVDKILKNLE